jgi:tripartite-type tricarboxylate transporter receptor subunit TctC
MSKHRSHFLPDTPTVSESIPGFNVESIFGIVVPSATPRDVVYKIYDNFAKVLKTPAVRIRMIESGLIPLGSNPEEFDAYIKAEIPKWAKAVKVSGAGE